MINNDNRSKGNTNLFLIDSMNARRKPAWPRMFNSVILFFFVMIFILYVWFLSSSSSMLFFFLYIFRFFYCIYNIYTNWLLKVSMNEQTTEKRLKHMNERIFCVVYPIIRTYIHKYICVYVRVYWVRAAWEISDSMKYFHTTQMCTKLKMDEDMLFWYI